jgi:hypothetical protein
LKLRLWDTAILLTQRVRLSRNSCWLASPPPYRGERRHQESHTYGSAHGTPDLFANLIACGRGRHCNPNARICSTDVGIQENITIAGSRKAPANAHATEGPVNPSLGFLRYRSSMAQQDNSRSVTVSEIRRVGVRQLLVYCGNSTRACTHCGMISLDGLADDLKIRSLRPRCRCEACGRIGGDVRPDYSIFTDKADLFLNSSANCVRIQTFPASR